MGFEHPFTCTVAGPTKSGKTEWVRKLLRAAPLYIDPPPTRIVWVSGIENERQKMFIEETVPYNIEFTNTIPDVESFSSNENNLLIVDDFMHEAGKNNTVVNLFTKGCHHRNISLILVLQNLFHQGRHMRDIHTSTTYVVPFYNPRDKAQIKYLSRQCFPDHPQFLTDAYNKACSEPYGYLILDFSQTTPEQYRVASGIFPPDVVKLYSPT